MASTSKDNNNNSIINNGDSNKESQEVEALVQDAMAYAKRLVLCHPPGHKNLIEALEMYRDGSIGGGWDFYKHIQTPFSESEYYLFGELFRIFFRKEPHVVPGNSEGNESPLRDLMFFYFSGEKTCAASGMDGEPRTDPRFSFESMESRAEEKGSESEDGSHNVK